MWCPRRARDADGSTGSLEEPRQSAAETSLSGGVAAFCGDPQSLDPPAKAVRPGEKRAAPPARIASLPVNRCQRSTMTSQYHPRDPFGLGRALLAKPAS